MAIQTTQLTVAMPQPTTLLRNTICRMNNRTQTTTSRISRPTPFFACQWMSGSSFFVRYGISASRPRYESTIISVRSELGLVPEGGGGGGGVYEPPGGTV